MSKNKKNNKRKKRKEVKISPNISNHDLGHKFKSAQKFLKKGHPVLISCNLPNRMLGATNGDDMLKEMKKHCKQRLENYRVNASNAKRNSRGYTCKIYLEPVEKPKKKEKPEKDTKQKQKETEEAKEDTETKEKEVNKE